MTSIARFGLAALSILGLAEVASAAGSAAQPTICTRSCWSARAPRSTPSQMASLTRAVIHHTAGASDYNTTSQSTSASLVRAIQNLHMDVNGWSDVGYHFMTDKLGNNFEGRSGSMSSLPRGAHDAVNVNSFGFNLMGYYHTPYNHTPTTVSRNALYDVIAWRMPNGFTGYGSGSYNGSTVGFLCGHRDVGATACPGDLMYTYIGTNVNGGEARNAVNSRIVGTPAVEVIVDNTSTGFSASTNWWTSTSTAGYYGTNYHTRATAAVSDSAKWNVTLPSDGTYKVFVRYASGTNRAAAAPFVVSHTGGNTTVNVNQQANGGTWVQLGQWNFFQGTAQRVQLSCWTTAGFYVVADAVRFVKQ
jgi:hypothetical protein